MSKVHHIKLKTDLKSGTLTVYGRAGCGWTTKQLSSLQANKRSFTYVDCSAGKCPDFVTGFPTIDNNGKIIAGFTKL